MMLSNDFSMAIQSSFDALGDSVAENGYGVRNG